MTSFPAAQPRARPSARADALPRRTSGGLAKSLIAAAVLVATVSIPSLGMAFGASSMAAGLAAVCATYAALLVVVAAVTPRGIDAMRGAPLKLAGATMAAVLVHALVAYGVNREGDLDRTVQTYVFLLVFVSGAAACSLIASRFPADQGDRVVRMAFWALAACGVAGALRFSPFFTDASYSKPVLVFAEPSHFALDFLPFAAYVLVRSNFVGRLLLFACFFALGGLLENVTLIVGAAFAGLLVFRWRHVPVLAALVALVVAFSPFKMVDLDYYSARVQLFGHANASTLTYRDGWERAYLSTVDSYGVGAGFQQFGIVGRFGEVDREFTDAGLANQNPKDGSTVGAKLIAEFGVLGLLLVAVYVARCFKKVAWLRRVAAGELSNDLALDVFFACCYVMFAVDLFVRGTGYFSSTAFLFAVSAMSMRRGPPPSRRGAGYRATSSSRTQSRQSSAR